MIKVMRDKLQSIAYEVVNLVMEKNADYGDAWQRNGIPGCMSKLADKLCRIEVLADGREALVVGEGLDNALRDAIGYSLLGLLYLSEKKAVDAPQRPECPKCGKTMDFAGMHMGVRLWWCQDCKEDHNDRCGA